MTPLLGCTGMTLGVALALLTARGCDQAAQNKPNSRTVNYDSVVGRGEGKTINPLWHLLRESIETPINTQNELGIKAIHNQGRKLTISDFGGNLILGPSIDYPDQLMVSGRFHKYKSQDLLSRLANKAQESEIALFDLNFPNSEDILVNGSNHDQLIRILELPDHVKSVTINLVGGKDIVFIKRGSKAKITINGANSKAHIIILDSKNTTNHGSITINTGDSPLNIYRVEEESIAKLRSKIMKSEPGIRTKDLWLKLRESIEANTVTCF